MTFIERFKVLMNHYDLSAAAFAKRIGVTSPCITHILSGRNKLPSTDILIKVSNSFPEVSTSWLLMGEGPMLLDGKKNEPSLFEEPGENPDADVQTDKPVQTVAESVDENLSGKAPESVREVNIPDKSMSGISDKIEQKSVSSPSVGRQRRVTQITLFYDDGTYEMFRQA